MSRAYSLDLRERMVDAAAANSCRQAAARFGVGVATAIHWMAALTTTGAVAARPQGRARRSKLDPHEAFLRALIDEKDDITLEEMHARLRDELDLTFGLSTLWAFLDARPDQIKTTAHATEQSRPDVKAAREAWIEGQPKPAPARLVFLNEIWTSTNMARTRVRSPRGERSRSPVPHGYWKTTTFVAGLLLSRIAAPFVLDGPIKRDAFFRRACARAQTHPRATSSSWTISAATRGRPCAQPSTRSAHSCCSCCPSRPTSNRSRWSSPSLRRCCARPPNAPSRGYVRPSDGSWTPLPQMIALFSSQPHHMSQIK